ncbi:hypothetical protein AB0G15_05600 [Streptosporangium sp. NPDC023825]|uniref:hypothetical protein n=1 Tax=Streptosporangium sp. NPDC023825 TaxID=3154909 RepID=UPI00343D1447
MSATTTRIRLLFCETCGSCEELPDYTGHPDGDTALAYLISSRHQFPSGDPHGGGHLADVSKAEWDNPRYRNQIIKQMNESIKAGGSEGLGNTFYETKNTFADDAGQCWKRHNRTTDCGDYRTPSKELVPDTKELRKEAGLSTRARDRPKIFLCDFCPVQSVIEQRKNDARGIYHFKN